MERLFGSRRSRISTLLFLTVIAVIIFQILSFYISPIILIFFVPIVMFGLYLGMIYFFFQGRRGYQNRYQKAGQERQLNEQLVRVLMLGGFAIILYFIVNAVMQEFEVYDPTLTFGITIVVVVAVVQFVDYYTSQDMVEYVEHKEKKHKNYVNSLGKAEGICMSCRRTIGDRDVCPHCGYSRKKVSSESNNSDH